MGEDSMSKGKIDYEGYLEFIKQFRNNEDNKWVENRLELQRKPNFWTILEYGEKSVKSYETRMARMFRWLLDPNETHGLGNIFAYKLFVHEAEDIKKGEKSNYTYIPGENPNVQATAEEKRIDLLYRDFSQNVIVAIELKQYAEEGESQLKNYEEVVEKMIAGKPIKPYYFYLTPLGKDSTRDRWIPISYGTFIEFIEQVEVEAMATSDIPYIEDTRKIVADFKDDLQRSIDIISVTANRAVLNDNISQDYIKLTRDLAKKILHNEKSQHLKRLSEINEDGLADLEGIILILNDALAAQNHTPHVGVQMLTRKIYNYFSDGDVLPTAPDAIEKYKVNKQVDTIKHACVEDGLPFSKIKITKDKGQGLYLYHDQFPYRIYISGDAYGHFPNHGVQLLPLTEKNGKKKSISRMNGEMFLLDEMLMLQDKLKTISGQVLTFDEFIQDYLVLSLKSAVEQIKDVMN